MGPHSIAGTYYQFFKNAKMEHIIVMNNSEQRYLLNAQNNTEKGFTSIIMKG